MCDCAGGSRGEVIYCALHGEAPQLYAALQVAYCALIDDRRLTRREMRRILEVLAQAEGRQKGD